MFDIVGLGELLIDFTECGKSPSGNLLFEQNPGGAPANVLSCASKLGLKTAFVGKVGRDMHGDFLAHVLQQSGIDTSGLARDPHFFTTLAFVSLNSDGDRSFSFSRKPGADTQLQTAELPAGAIETAKIFHFGSLSLTDEPSRSATLAAAARAREAGVLVSYDPNYRAPLWESEQAATAQTRGVLPLVDLIKISAEETVLLTGKALHEQAAQVLLAKGCSVAVITLGSAGAYVATKAGGAHVPQCFSAHVSDTTGAGDAFWGGFLTAYIKSGLCFADIGLADVIKFAHFGNAVASCCVEKRGAIAAMPSPEALEQRILQCTDITLQKEIICYAGKTTVSF